MKRFITEDFIKWKNSIDRKPLIVRGARQVGKTFIIKEFGNDYYEDVAYFNFDHDINLGNIFINTKDPKRIIEQLIFVNGKAIKPNTTLIVFDEIQECPDALNSLKYFQEECPEYHIISAGSLLGIRLSKTSFPVGKVNYLDLMPMSFSEFLLADDSEKLVDYMKSIKSIDNIPEILFEQLNEKLKAYFIVGGMPEVVNSWVTTKDIEKVNTIQKEILDSYESDFSKHIDIREANKVSLVWNSIPSQLSRENKKFLYQLVKEGARAREYEDALNWLNDANLIYKTYNINSPKLPLKSYENLNAFKIYLGDVGLLRKMSELDSSIIKDGNRLYTEFKGSLTENYVLNQLTNILKTKLHYYTFDQYEIDFIIQYKNNIIPIEVKSGKNTNNRSLTVYNENTPYKLRFSDKNLVKDGNIINIPLFLIEYIKNIL